MEKTPKFTDSKARTAERQSRFRARRKVEKLAAEQSAGARYSAPGKLEELADTISIVAYNSLTFAAEDPHDRRFSGPGVRLETIQRHLESEFERAVQHLPLERVNAYVDYELRSAAERREDITRAQAAERRATKRKPNGPNSARRRLKKGSRSAQRSDRKRKH